MVTLENILSSIALFFAIVFGLFAFLFSFISLSHSLDDSKRTSEQDNAMFSLAYQFLSFGHLAFINTTDKDDRVIVQQLSDMKHDLSKCVNLRLWKEIRGDKPDIFYEFLKICMICDQNIQSRTENFSFFRENMERDFDGFENFSDNYVMYVAKLVYKYNVDAKIRHSKPIFKVISFMNGIFSIKHCTLSYDSILTDMEHLFMNPLITSCLPETSGIPDSPPDNTAATGLPDAPPDNTAATGLPDAPPDNTAATGLPGAPLITPV